MRWLSRGPAGTGPAGTGQTVISQAVTGSVVIGDVVQLAHVNGDVTIGTDRPPYRIERMSATAVPLRPERARAQPSLLLLARHQIVPFAGRDRLLADLAGWADADAGEPMAVRLIHAAGGQGKTRLAAELAADRTAASWAVWRVTHTPSLTSDPATPVDLGPAPPSGAVLGVVDYADRWPTSHLLALLTRVHALGARTETVVRVLLLARSAGFWWPALADRLDSDLAVAVDDLVLPPLAEHADRGALFTTAAEHFAAALGVESAGWPVPPALDGPGYDQVLAIHMAALAAVDARRHGDTAPTQPHAVSAYLVRREYAHWHRLHARAEDPLPTPPAVLRRATYTATLTGPLPRATGRDTLVRVGLASTVPDADRILDDHRACHPPADPATVLAALRPDRLGEDFIALSIPGHPYRGGDTAHLADDWTLTATPALLAAAPETATGRTPAAPDRTPAGPGWTPAAVTVLVETARRWPHVATRVLYPLLRERPELALSAGGSAITRLADLPDADPTVLEAIEPLLPTGPHTDLAGAAAAVSTVLTRHRLAATTDPTARANLHTVHALCLYHAGRYAEAVPPARDAVALHAELVETDPYTHLPRLARALSNLGIFLGATGDRDDALTTAERATGLYRRLAQLDPGAHLADLGTSLNSLSGCAAELGHLEKALAAGRRAVVIHRWQASGDPDTHLYNLAMSLNNLAQYLAMLGRYAEALTAAEEATGHYRRLVERDPVGILPRLASVLTNLSFRLSDAGRRDEALAAAEESVARYRPLADANPKLHLGGLATALIALGDRLSGVGRQDEAVAAAEESVVIHRRLAEASPAVHRRNLGIALNNLGVLLASADRTAEALSRTEEAVAIRRRLAAAHPDAHRRDLAGSLHNLGVMLAEMGQREAARLAGEEAARLNGEDAAQLNGEEASGPNE